MNLISYSRNKAVKASRQKHVVVLTGMHRSGTSLVSSILQHAGVNMGEDLIGPLKGNPRGHFEDKEFFQLHEKILRRFGQNIFVQDSSALGEINQEETEEALGLIRQRNSYWVWGWKDPRTSLFLDFWQRLLPGSKYIFIYRHPLEVVLSLIRRGTDPEMMHSPLAGLRAWEVYNEQILGFYEKHAEDCLLCHIFGIVNDFKLFMDIAEENLSLPLQRRGAQSLFFQNELKNSNLPGKANEIMGEIEPEALGLYELLEARADIPCLSQNSADDSLSFDHLASLTSSVMSDTNMRDAAKKPLFYLLLSMLDPNAFMKTNVQNSSRL